MPDLTYNPLSAGVEEIRQSWDWFLSFGTPLTILGIARVSFDETTYACWFSAGPFNRRHLWSDPGLILQYLERVRFLSAQRSVPRIHGLSAHRYPAIGAETVTLVLASFFIVMGMFCAIGFGMARFPQWDGAAFSGMLSIVLGIVLLLRMPTSSGAVNNEVDKRSRNQ